MAIRDAELVAQRRLTGAFVEADEFTVSLTRRTAVANGAGGRTFSETTLTPQIFRLIPLGDVSGGAALRTTVDGESVTPGYMLLGPHGANLQRGDRFVKDGRRYEVVFLVENQQYQKKAEVAYLG